MSPGVEVSFVNIIGMAPPKPVEASNHLGPRNTSTLTSLLHPTTDGGSPAVGGRRGVEHKLRRPGDIVRGYLDTRALLNARAVSRSVKAWVEEDIGAFNVEAFGTLSLGRRYRSLDDQALSLRALKNVAPFCNHFMIRLGNIAEPAPPQPYSSRTAAVAEQSIWMLVFGILSSSIITLSISAPGYPDWHSFGPGEAQLESIRVALETHLPRGLRSITLSPINSMGLVHFRWRGAAFREASWMAESFWSRLTQLTLDLLNPMPHLHKSSRKDFIKTLHDFIGSFSRYLRVFHFSWVGAAGPNPLLLDLRYGGHNFSSPAIKWGLLEEVILGNVFSRDGDLVALRKTRCHSLKDFILVEEPGDGEEQEVIVWEEAEEVEADVEDRQVIAPRAGTPSPIFPISLG